ncbi:hypothetical protein HUW51_08530 [Adhaeribacter swui]|uniref:Lipoprotein n=1 Tax=Adhaeribacter swui TaxID=2086471 RepID=A0A7G7G6J0_9BACT|nr:hypothetical protein [Adhaeribacter swui]QNF32774.1 hypothetical protein HUW51_08530 [Adhaeribacter swui]
MTTKAFTLALVLGTAFMVACSSEPSDLRPDKKVSVDYVPAGTRNSSNLDNTKDNSGHDNARQDVNLNHDEHANKALDDSKEQVKDATKTNQSSSVENHE